MRCPLDVRVAVATIHAELAHVQLVAVRDRLQGRVADLQILRREVIPKNENDSPQKADCAGSSEEGELIERPGKDLHFAWAH